MAVLKRFRQISPRQFHQYILDLSSMIDHDVNKMSLELRKCVYPDVAEKLSELNNFAYRFNNIYVNKTTKSNLIRRNILIIKMNATAIELHRALLPFIIFTPKTSKFRVSAYTDLINNIIFCNEHNYYRGDEVTDAMYNRIDEYENYLIELSKEIAADSKYRFERCYHFSKKEFHTAEYLKATKALSDYTLKKIKRLSDTNRLTYGMNLKRLSSDIMYYCGKANSIFPETYEEYRQRLKYMQTAKSLIDEYDRALFDFINIFDLSKDVITVWTNKYMDVAKLIRAIMKSDKKRFGNLPKKKDLEPKGE